MNTPILPFHGLILPGADQRDKFIALPFPRFPEHGKNSERANLDRKEIEGVNVQFSVFQEENGISRLIFSDLTYLPGEAKRRW